MLARPAAVESNNFLRTAHSAPIDPLKKRNERDDSPFEDDVRVSEVAPGAGGGVPEADGRGEGSLRRCSPGWDWLSEDACGS